MIHRCGMKPMQRFERVLKDLGRLGSDANEAAKLPTSLENKLSRHRFQKALEEARRKLHHLYFDAQDAFDALQIADDEVKP